MELLIVSVIFGVTLFTVTRHMSKRAEKQKLAYDAIINEQAVRLSVFYDAGLSHPDVVKASIRKRYKIDTGVTKIRSDKSTELNQHIEHVVHELNLDIHRYDYSQGASNYVASRYAG